MELYLLRHGESVNNTLPEDRHIPDPELTDLGRAQAERLARAVALMAPECIISSPLLRSLQTARPLAAALPGVPWLVWADVAEAHRAHPSDGQETALLRERFPEAAFEPDMPWPGYPGPELAEAAGRRADRLLARLCAAFPEPSRRVAVVAHGGLNQYVLRACMGAPQTGTVALLQDNCCLNHVCFEGEQVRVVRTNDTRHLA